jgi:hypothetical protein
MDARYYVREKLFNLTMSKVCQLVVSVHEIKSGKCNKKAIAFPYRTPLILKMQNVSVLLKKIKTANAKDL